MPPANDPVCAKMALDAFSTRFADERNSIGCINDARSTPCFERGRDDAIVERSAIRKVTYVTFALIVLFHPTRRGREMAWWLGKRASKVAQNCF